MATGRLWQLQKFEPLPPMTGPAALWTPKEPELTVSLGPHPLIRTTASHSIDLEAQSKNPLDTRAQKAIYFIA